MLRNLLEDNGLPVHLKGGVMDNVLYKITMGLTVVEVSVAILENQIMLGKLEEKGQCIQKLYRRIKNLKKRRVGGISLMVNSLHRSQNKIATYLTLAISAVSYEEV
ncbi:hypothetical protein AAES_185019 [Amazona aestiva]|uniref:Uncharacterized protein n=1 Tax=Amazona aestiva TaxID=12930 RepID=A0A0Q3TL29_AMAAE|nr:hypothetical protein AAES_185019 [Amazona aestiva]